MPLMDVFFDADAIIAGSASKTGASSILLQLSEFGLLNGVTCQQVLDECQRNILKKIPNAIDNFNLIVSNSLSVIENSNYVNKYSEMADAKDLIILTLAIENDFKYFVTFNTKHYYPEESIGIKVVKPSELLHVIRNHLSDF